jgi:hypothetical protein
MRRWQISISRGLARMLSPISCFLSELRGTLEVKSDRAERFFLWVAQAAARVIARRDSENRRSPFGPRQTADFYDARNSSDCDELTA